MGDKTDKYMEAITSSGKECRKQLDVYVLKMQQIEKLTELQIEAIKAFGPVWKLHLAKYNNNEDEAKKNWDSDQDVKEKYQAMLNAEKNSVDAIDRANFTRESIEEDLSEMESDLNTFAEFIKKKKNKKFTFRSKKSLPLAEEFIKDQGLILENLKSYFARVKKLFDV